MAVVILSLKLTLSLRKSLAQCEKPIPYCACVLSLNPWLVCCCSIGGISAAKVIHVKLFFGLWISALAGQAVAVVVFVLSVSAMLDRAKLFHDSVTISGKKAPKTFS